MKRWLAFCSVMALMTSMTAGCFAGSTQPTHRVALILQESPYEFWINVKQGADAGAAEFGVQLLQYANMVGPMNAEKQIESLRLALEDGVDAVVISPIDSVELERLIKQSRNSGTPVVSIHSGSVTSPFRVTEDYEQTAELALEALKSVSDGGEIALINAGSTDLPLSARQQALVDRFANHPEFRIAETLVTADDKRIVMEQVKTMLEQRKGISAMIGICEGCAIGAALAVRDLGLAEQTAVIGFDSTDSAIHMLEEEWLDAMIVQNSFAMGYLGVKMVAEILDGHRKEKDGPIYTQSVIIYKESLQLPEYQKMLYPFMNR